MSATEVPAIAGTFGNGTTRLQSPAGPVVKETTAATVGKSTNTGHWSMKAGPPETMFGTAGMALVTSSPAAG